MQLALVLMLALGQPAAEQPAAPVVLAAAHTAPANPLAFSSRSWLDALAAMRSDQRFARYASRIFRTSSGEVYVPVERERREIEALRSDAVIARHVAEQFARANAAELSRGLGRAAAAADLYLAHLAGVRTALQFRREVTARPRQIAAAALPELAEAVPELLFAGDDALTLAEVAAALERRSSRAFKRLHPADAEATRVLGWQARVEPK